jgi:hypothetical protein
MPDSPSPDPATSPTDPEVLSPGGGLTVAPSYSWWSRLIPGSRRREMQLARLQAGHEQVVGLVHAIRTNLEAQVDTQRRLLRGLDALPDAVDGLRKVGELTEQQKEVLGVIRAQLDQTAEQNRTMAGSLERFSQTMVSMESSTRTLAIRAESSEQSLRHMLERSERRLMLLNTVLIFLLVAGFAWLATRPPPAASAAPAPSVESPAPVVVAPVPPEAPSASVATALVPASPEPVPPPAEETAAPAPVAATPAENPAPTPEPTPEPPPPPAPAPAEQPPLVPEAPPAPAQPTPVAPTPVAVPEAEPVLETPTQARLREIREQMERLRRERETKPTP